MAIKKSELYSSLWASCDELRGGMDASQYKDYVPAQILEIDKAATSAETSVYDPTCGSGSLLLKVADQASTEVSLFGQEKDASTTADIQNGNTLSDPLFKDDAGKVETWDYVVANPPFSDKSWSTG